MASASNRRDSPSPQPDPIYAWRTSSRHSLQIHDLDPAILRPRRLVASGSGRTLFAIAHCGQLNLACTLQHQRATYCLGATLTEADVVLTRAALVRVPL